MGRWLHNGDLKLEPRSTPPTDTVHMSYACIYLFACFFFPRRDSITRDKSTRSLLLLSHHLKTGKAVTAGSKAR